MTKLICTYKYNFKKSRQKYDNAIKFCFFRFPLIDNKIRPYHQYTYINKTKIEQHKFSLLIHNHPFDIEPYYKNWDNNYGLPLTEHLRVKILGNIFNKDMLK